MLEGLPIELVGNILRVLAEISLPTERGTILQIALVGTIGYTAAVPVLYRTVSISDSNISAVSLVFNEEPTAFSRGMLKLPPAHRLCPHVRRIFLKTNSSFPNFRLITKLETVVTVSCIRSILPPENFPHLARSLAHYFSLTVVHPDELPPTVTHASFYIHLWEATALSIFQEYAQAAFRDTLTHVAIELNEVVDDSYKPQLVKLLSFLLSRPTAVLVVLRVYRAAAHPRSVAAVVRAIGTLAGASRQRILLWKDQRQMDTVKDDIATSLRDIVEGRTPWSEGRCPKDGDLDDMSERLEEEDQDSETSSSGGEGMGIEAGTTT